MGGGDRRGTVGSRRARGVNRHPPGCEQDLTYVDASATELDEGVVLILELSVMAATQLPIDRLLATGAGPHYTTLQTT